MVLVRQARDPQVDDEEGIISKVPFEELIKVFPNTRQVRRSLSGLAGQC